MRTEFLSFSPPCLGEDEIAAVTEVLRQGTWLSSGPKTREFEQRFCEAVQAPAALALNSCTAGLHLALKVHGVGPGDEVLTTPITFCATANVVEHLGGTVRLADVDPETLLIDPGAVAKQINARTKVLLPVHYAGQPCDMAALLPLAQSVGAAVVEDAAHCLPTRLGDQPVGHADHFTAFSFYATKNITTGEGGMLTGKQEWVDAARTLALHGMSRNAWDRFAKGGSWKYDLPQPGYKYNLTDIASALGVVQLARLPELYERRMAVVNTYNDAFANLKFLRPLHVRPGVQSSHHLYVVRLNLNALTIDRDRFISELAERNIGSSVHYTPLHLLSFYAKKYGWKPDDFPHAHQAFERMLSLPLSSKMTKADAEDVVQAVSDITRRFGR